MKSKSIFNLLDKGSVDVARPLKQTGFRKSEKRDKGRDARLPGKRISKNGNTYWETRKNRSDAPNSDI